MKALILGLTIAALFIFESCSENAKVNEQVLASPHNLAPIEVVKLDSCVLINTCGNKTFISKLEELPNLDKNAFRLTIESRNGSLKKVHTLDARPSLTSISYCTDDYTVVGFSCGGPCYSQIYVFTKEERPNEQYDYAQQIHGISNIIAHIEHEEFEKLILHNFENGKEMKVDISDGDLMMYGQMDSIYKKNHKIVLNYSSPEQKPITKIVHLDSIL